MEFIREHAGKLAGGTVSVGLVLMLMWGEIDAVESKADSAQVQAARNTATLEQAVKSIDRSANAIERLIDLELAKRGQTRPAVVETVMVVIPASVPDSSDSS